MGCSPAMDASGGADRRPFGAPGFCGATARNCAALVPAPHMAPVDLGRWLGRKGVVVAGLEVGWLGDALILSTSDGFSMFYRVNC